MTEDLGPFTRQEYAEVVFLLSLLDSQFGGAPSLGAGEDGTYIVAPMCRCPVCDDFRKTYKIKPQKTILAAAKAYGDNKLCQESTREHAESGEVSH